MDKITRYKKLFPSEDGVDDLIVHPSGKVTMPKWLICLLLHSSGIKSRKKRTIKKILKTQLKKLISNYVISENREN
jgi:hypothetical protein